MKLAEALILRADCQKRLAQLQQRLARSAVIQEGEAPPENPQVLIAEVNYPSPLTLSRGAFSSPRES